MKALTAAQVALLRNLDDGWEVTFSDSHYVTVKDGLAGAKLWPSTFYGLFDGRMVQKLNNGNYTISYHGQRQIRSKDSGVVEAPENDQESVLEKTPTGGKEKT